MIGQIVGTVVPFVRALWTKDRNMARATASGTFSLICQPSHAAIDSIRPSPWSMRAIVFRCPRCEPRSSAANRSAPGKVRRTMRMSTQTWSSVSSAAASGMPLAGKVSYPAASRAWHSQNTNPRSLSTIRMFFTGGPRLMCRSVQNIRAIAEPGKRKCYSGRTNNLVETHIGPGKESSNCGQSVTYGSCCHGKAASDVSFSSEVSLALVWYDDCVIRQQGDVHFHVLPFEHSVVVKGQTELLSVLGA